MFINLLVLAAEHRAAAIAFEPLSDLAGDLEQYQRHVTLALAYTQAYEKGVGFDA